MLGRPVPREISDYDTQKTSYTPWPLDADRELYFLLNRNVRLSIPEDERFSSFSPRLRSGRHAMCLERHVENGRIELRVARPLQPIPLRPSAPCLRSQNRSRRSLNSIQTPPSICTSIRCPCR